MKTTFSDNNASYVKTGFPCCRNELLMVGLSSETSIYYSRTDRKSENQNATVTVETYLFYC